MHVCARELYRLLEETTRFWLAGGPQAPVVEGDDLNAEKAQILASYHPRCEVAEPGGTVYEDEGELEQAFEARRSSA